MWERCVLCWKICMLLVIGSILLGFCLQGENVVNRAADAGILLLLLCCAYRFGAGMGALTGCLCGLVVFVWSKNLEAMGMYAFAGSLIGTFGALGRIGAVTACLCSVFGLGVLTNPTQVFHAVSNAVFAGIVFFLLPDRLLQIKETIPLRKQDIRVPDAIFGDSLRQAGEACAALGGYFADEQLAKVFLREEEWKQMYLELRVLLAEQMHECAELFKDAANLLGENAAVSKKMQRKLIERLDKLGVGIEKMSIVHGNRKRGALLLLMYAKSDRCVTMKLIREAVSETVGRALYPDTGQSLVLPKTPILVRFQETPAYFILHGVAQEKKSGEVVNGDSFSFQRIGVGEHFFFLCDGMGSGEQAQKESAGVSELAEQLLKAGYSSQVIVRLINNALVIQGREHPITIDMGRIDLYSGICDFTKSGASITLICREDRVETLSTDSLPIGILQESAPTERLLKLQSGDMIIMMTDGVLEAIPGLEKEEQLKAFCLEQRVERPKDFARKILQFVQGFGQAKDDMTVLVIGVWKR